MQSLRPLNRLVAGIAVDAVNVQRLLDEAHACDLARLRAAERLPVAFAEALVADRLRVKRFEMEAGVVLGETRTTGFRVGAFTVNAGFEMRYGAGVERQSRIRICVDQVPVEASSTPQSSP